MIINIVYADEPFEAVKSHYKYILVLFDNHAHLANN